MQLKEIEREKHLKNRDLIIVSYIISILLLAVPIFQTISSLKGYSLIYHLSINPLFFLIFFSVLYFLEHKIDTRPTYLVYLMASLFVGTITFLIYFSITYSDSVYNGILIVYYFIPIILYTINYGHKFGQFVAVFSGGNILFLDYVTDSLTSLNIDLILIIIYFWIVWLIGSKMQIEEDIQEELNNLNQKLIESQELFKINFEEAPVGMIISDLEGNIIKANKTICNLLGSSLENLNNKKAYDFISEDDIEKVTEFKEKLLRDELKSVTYETRLKKPDGNHFWVNYIMSLVKAEKKPLYFLCQIEDINNKKIIEEKLRKQKEQLEYNQLRTKFFAKMSHELKTPLNLIFTSLQLIVARQKNNGELIKIDKYIKLIKQNSYRLLRLVNNIIDLTKIDTNSLTINPDNYDIISLIEQITLSTREYVNNHGKKLEFNTDISQKNILCDPFCMERIILNLISNAVKFTNNNDTISVNVFDQEASVLITVRDTGIGIKRENFDLIFEQFRQADESFTRRSEGTGIGLSLVKSLVELHDGQIWVESAYGHGSEFFILLPALTKNKPQSNYSPYNLIDKVNVELADIYDL